MRLLLDTHVLLWWVTDAPSVTTTMLRRIGDPANIVHVSTASIWETSIKATTGRLDVEVDEAGLRDGIETSRFEVLPVGLVHAWRAGALPLHHRDPFDRMLVAQAQVERLTLVTADATLAAYDVETLAP